VVLDTNVVLDWLLFDEALCRPLARQVESGALRWLATAAMRDELAQVLQRPMLQRWEPDCVRILSIFDSCADLVATSDISVAPAHLRCRDGDDQKFLDLAHSAGAQWLISHDRALLDLAKRARPLGFQILTPVLWSTRNA
jgi:putative PIN family toxin of toxin-antitoxin system